MPDSQNPHATQLPSYAPMLAAYHEAFGPELAAMIRSVPARPGPGRNAVRILDVACGDATYARLWSEQLGVASEIVALDLSRAWLASAAEQIVDRPIALCQAKVDALPFADGAFDVAWCPQSLYSLPDMQACLNEMVRVVRSEGIVALVENDELHHILLPWPIDVELHLRAAEWKAFRQQHGPPSRFYVGRWLTRLLRTAGLRHVRERCYASVRQQPLTPPTSKYLTEYLRALRARVTPHLKPRMARRLAELADPDHRRFLLRRPDLTVICLDRLVTGVKP
ncbi:MAG: methyltransferase domain-containing protein [Planctomycetaceae bacterium]|nr:methyltransferase domain-containing protein [Planctomycetaceae bacterium]